ncbi:hypothetical protein AAC387_Pa08g1723 [Persea americana]
MTLPLTNAAQDHNSFVFSDLAVILAIVVLVVIVTIALNASFFYYLRRFAGRSLPSNGAGNPVVKPPPPEIAALPMIVFSEGMKLAGTEAECVICLSEFKLGEEINVLPRCHHGFHVKCIDGWWSALHFSCPTCRTRYSPLELEKSPSLPENQPENSAEVETQNKEKPLMDTLEPKQEALNSDGESKVEQDTAITGPVPEISGSNPELGDPEKVLEAGVESEDHRQEHETSDAVLVVAAQKPDAGGEEVAPNSENLKKPLLSE